MNYAHAFQAQSFLNFVNSKGMSSGNYSKLSQLALLTWHEEIAKQKTEIQVY